MEKGGDFHTRLKWLINQYVLITYKITEKYPKHELYGLVSQDRRASVSVMLNCIEGYARMRQKVHKNFLETAFASLKESMYVKYLACQLNYINKSEYMKVYSLKDEIGAMLYKTITRL